MQGTIRYSPKPVEAYVKTYKVQTIGRPDEYIRVGPAVSRLLTDDNDTWNLAYLSHDYEDVLLHSDALFTTHVRRTVQTLLDGSGLDLAGQAPVNRCIRSFVRQPPEKAAYLLRNFAFVKQTPMYVHYGEAWLNKVDEIAFRLSSGVPDNVEHVDDAAALLQRLRLK